MEETFENADLLKILSYVLAFAMISIASGKIAGFFKKIKLPLITGLLLAGILAGPDILGMIDSEAIPKLRFINDISLAFIALAVGTELYIKELRSRLKSITWMTASQLGITFIFGFTAVWYLADLLPFMSGMDQYTHAAVALFAGTIFVARSPASAIAIVNEMRAFGPYTQTALGVTVLKDFLVIILFSVVFTVSDSLIRGEAMGFGFALLLIVELGLSLLIGLGLWKLLNLILHIKGKMALKSILMLASGYGVYLISYLLRDLSVQYIHEELYVEPLLVCIIGSFALTNYSRYRPDFARLIEVTGPFVYVVFFTLTGASLAIGILRDVWVVALILFFVRIVSLVIAGFVGGSLAGDPPRLNRLAWMPYVTQAGVALGLASVIASEYPAWGPGFATMIVAVIVLNQIFGPPFFKWAINIAGEAHKKGEQASKSHEKILIFGLESQSIALAKQLKLHNWKVSIASQTIENGIKVEKGIKIVQCPDISVDSLRKLNAWNVGTIVCLLSDEENYTICELAYEHFGTRNLIVRLQDRGYYKKFRELGAQIMEPATAMVSLLEHYVRSPLAVSLLMGEGETQDTIDVEIINPDIHGLTLRDLRLPTDVIILSVTRGEQMIISHGYTRLRLGDIVTLVGAPSSLENVKLRIQGY
jgi:Trk K+ transport system NAD-binding subunit/Kef-type K+ transport system membrane component KefB